MNKCFFTGRMTADPELRYTANGKPVVSFCLAAERRYKNANGENVTDFFDFIAWNSLAEFVARNLAKGRKILVEAAPQTRTWIDRNGFSRRSVEFVVEGIEFADSRPRLVTEEEACVSDCQSKKPCANTSRKKTGIFRSLPC